MRRAQVAILLILSGGIAPAQTFQSASIHPSQTRPGMNGTRMYMGGRGSMTFTASNASLASLAIMDHCQGATGRYGRADSHHAPEPAGHAILNDRPPRRQRDSQYQLSVLPLKPLLANTEPPAAVPGETESREPDTLQARPGARTSIAIGNGGGRIVTAADAQNTLAEALKTQLGLKLEHKKGPIDIPIVDHAKSTPHKTDLQRLTTTNAIQGSVASPATPPSPSKSPPSSRPRRPTAKPCAWAVPPIRDALPAPT